MTSQNRRDFFYALIGLTGLVFLLIGLFAQEIKFTIAGILFLLAFTGHSNDRQIERLKERIELLERNKADR